MDIELTPGVDPFDALAGRRVPRWLRQTPRLRQLLIQGRKRIPLELGALLGVEPFIMAKGLGCFLAAEARRHVAGHPEAYNRAKAIARALPATGGACGAGAWGYEFDVQTRWGFYAGGTPNLIATTFVGRGFLEAGLAFDREDWLEQARLAANYLISTLLVREVEAPFFLYTPDSTRLVHNANLLGAGFVSGVGALSGYDGWVDIGVEAAGTSISAMSALGEWPYGEGSGLGWDDSFHTAYDLDGLSWVSLMARSDTFDEALSLAAESWARDFFGPAGEPHYYRASPYPYDIHSAATAVDVASRLAMRGVETGIADRVAQWARANLVDPNTGLTYYQVHRRFTDRRNFRRWGDAHWALASSALELRADGLDAPIESAISRLRRQTG